MDGMDTQIQPSSSSSPSSPPSPGQLPADSEEIKGLFPELKGFIVALETDKGMDLNLQVEGAVQQEADYLLKKLEELNSPHLEKFFIAMEGQIKGWEVLLENLARVEGLLARWDSEARDRLEELVPKYVEYIQNVPDKTLVLSDMTFLMERISARATLLSRIIDLKQNRNVTSHCSHGGDDQINLNLSSHFLKICEEIRRRVNLVNDLLCRRIEEIDESE